MDKLLTNKEAFRILLKDLTTMESLIAMGVGLWFGIVIGMLGVIAHRFYEAFF